MTMKNVAGFHSLDFAFLTLSPVRRRRGFGIIDCQKEACVMLGKLEEYRDACCTRPYLWTTGRKLLRRGVDVKRSRRTTVFSNIVKFNAIGTVICSEEMSDRVEISD